MEAGDFRQDLFYRINVLSLKLPPLRERGKDVLDLAESIIASKAETLGLAKRGLAPEAIQAVMTYRWPGNVRELENAIERALILSETEQINIDALGIDMQLIETESQQDAIDDLSPNKSRKVAQIKNDPTEDLSLEDYFQRFVLENQDQMNETELAKKLGISRKCLWERRQRLDIPRNKTGAQNDDLSARK